MKAVGSDAKVQRSLKRFATRRGFPLLIERFSVVHGTFAVGRGFSERLKKSTVSDSLLRGDK